MVFGLASDFEEAQGAVGVEGGSGQHFEEIGLADVIGAGAGDENAAGAQHFEGAEIEFFVATESGIEIALGFGEGWRIENDGVVLLAGGGVVLEQIEGVGFNPFDFMNLGSVRLGGVEGGVLVGDFESGARAVDSGDMGAARGEMQRESALVAEDVERLAVGVVRGGEIVFALVEKGSGLLAGKRVEMEANSVHGDDG